MAVHLLIFIPNLNQCENPYLPFITFFILDVAGNLFEQTVMSSNWQPSILNLVQNGTLASEEI